MQFLYVFGGRAFFRMTNHFRKRARRGRRISNRVHSEKDSQRFNSAIKYPAQLLGQSAETVTLSRPHMLRASPSFLDVSKDVDGRDIGERSDAVLGTAMPGHDAKCSA
jgi:hypothetical protein